MDTDNRDPLGKSSLTDRGFRRVNFNDAYGAAAYIQCSSAIGEYPDSMQRPGTSYLWLGVSDPEPKVMAKHAAAHGVQTTQTAGWVPYPIPAMVAISTSMHLNREQVAGLIGRLQHWLDHGDFEACQ